MESGNSKLFFPSFFLFKEYFCKHGVQIDCDDKSDEIIDTCRQSSDFFIVGLPAKLTYNFNNSYADRQQYLEEMDDEKDCPNSHFLCPEGKKNSKYLAS